MRMRILSGICGILAALVYADVGVAQFQVQADDENVVASKLDGQWERDAELTKRLGGTAAAKLSFTSDARVAAKIPAKYQRFFNGKQVYMAGVLTLRDKEHPFILIEHKGNPHVVFFRERDGDPFGDAESFNVMLAVGKDKRDDLLFMGGDFNNQPFAAYRRVKTDAK